MFNVIQSDHRQQDHLVEKKYYTRRLYRDVWNRHFTIDEKIAHPNI